LVAADWCGPTKGIRKVNIAVAERASYHEEKRRVRKARRWKSIRKFRTELVDEHEGEAAPPVYLNDTPRRTLRQPIVSALREHGPTDAQTLRGIVLRGGGLDASAARLVNYHALALSDLRRAGWVRVTTKRVKTARGSKSVQVYEASKPRVRAEGGKLVPVNPDTIQLHDKNKQKRVPQLFNDPNEAERTALLRALGHSYQTTRDLKADMQTKAPSWYLVKRLKEFVALGLVEASSARSHWRFTKDGHALATVLLRAIDHASESGGVLKVSDLTWEPLWDADYGLSYTPFEEYRAKSVVLGRGMRCWTFATHEDGLTEAVVVYPDGSLKNAVCWVKNS
jgi:hypothetical protein